MIEIAYECGDRLGVQVRGHRLTLDQPVAAGGEDTGPTPTELFVAGLAACEAFYAERFLARHFLPAAGLRVTCHYDMAEGSPSRVEDIRIELHLPVALSPHLRRTLGLVLDRCTVRNSIEVTPRIEVVVDEAAIAA